MIIGCSGSGKSTLARALGERLALPVIHLDQEYFGPGWKEPRQETWQDTTAALAARERWVMDGNYSGTFAQRMPRADTVIFLDQPTWRCVWRVLWRTLRYHGQERPSSAPGCPERFDLHFLHYVIAYNVSRRPGILKRLTEEEEKGKTIHHLRGNTAVSRLLKSLSPGPSGRG